MGTESIDALFTKLESFGNILEKERGDVINKREKKANKQKSNNNANKNNNVQQLETKVTHPASHCMFIRTL